MTEFEGGRGREREYSFVSLRILLYIENILINSQNKAKKVHLLHDLKKSELLKPILGYLLV